MRDDGATSQVSTAGIFFGDLVFHEDRLFVSSLTSEVVIDRAGTTEVRRDHDQWDAQWWAGATRAAKWSVFNIGTRNTNGYFIGVSATTGVGRVSETVLRGDILGVSACNSGLQIALGKWSAGGNGRQAKLVTLDAVGRGISTTQTRRVTLPDGFRLTNLACASDELRVLAKSGPQQLVGTVRKGEVAWVVVPRPTDFRTDDQVLGAVGNELITYYPREGVRALNLETLQARTVVDSGPDETLSKFALSGNDLVGWVQSDHGSWIRTYRVSTGEIVNEVPGDRVEEILDSKNEMVSSGPVWLSAQLPTANQASIG